MIEVQHCDPLSSSSRSSQRVWTFLKHVMFSCLGVVGCFSLVHSAFGENERQAEATRKNRPNIVLFLVDDLGKEWVGCYGAESIETPNIDKLAATGTKFDHFYVMPQCTPTRMSLLTGQYPFRHGWVNHWDVPRWGGGCHYDWERNPCLPRQIKDAGYATAIAGKWQLNDFRVQPTVLNDMGFDEYLMWTGGEGGNPKSDERYWEPYIHSSEGSRLYDDEFGPDLFCNFLLDFIKRKQDEPFFVYYPMVLTHPPLVTTPEDPDATGREGKHSAMVRYTDKITGRILNQLDELGIRENTIVIWTTDNGTSKSIVGKRNGVEVSGQKSETTEPGICVPMIVSYPEKMAMGESSNALSDITDLFPTLCDLAEAELGEHTLDGVSQSRTWLEGEPSPREWILAMGGKNQARLTDKGVENQFIYRDRVLRNQRFKLCVGTDRIPNALYDLNADPWEKVNLINSDSAEVKAAIQLLSKPLSQFPNQDADPIYTPLPSQEWDVPVKAKSQVWKKN